MVYLILVGSQKEPILSQRTSLATIFLTKYWVQYFLFTSFGFWISYQWFKLQSWLCRNLLYCGKMQPMWSNLQLWDLQILYIMAAVKLCIVPVIKIYKLCVYSNHAI